MADASAQVAALSAQRSTALTAMQAAGGSDIALNQARVAEAGELGAQIESLSEQLAKHGDTVQGTGSFVHPLDGTITSPFGMRFHPILHYTKLHTGTDFAGGSIIRAADDGRVIMTVLSSAYGNFTVIDHGVVNGKQLTTAYAHQARFLVRQGQVVHKGDPIGIVGSTGYATGPHLHFEVRENGTVIDPMAHHSPLTRGQADARTTRWVDTVACWSTSRPSIRASRSAAIVRPIGSTGWCTVVSSGSVCRLITESSKPITATSSGNPAAGLAQHAAARRRPSGRRRRTRRPGRAGRSSSDSIAVAPLSSPKSPATTSGWSPGGRRPPGPAGSPRNRPRRRPCRAGR